MGRRLPPLPTVADIIKLYGLSARSQLSQNFLLDLNVTDRLVRVAGLSHGCCVCEVGPGPGSLTRSVLNAGVSRLVVIEKDRRFLPSLELLRDASNGRMEIHHGDALQFDIERHCSPHIERKEWSEDPPSFHIVGNLPFNVSIPLLLQWLSLIPARQGPFSFGRSQLTLTFQKEVAERIMAAPGDPQRSRLSVMAQHLCRVQWGFKLRGAAFVPPPKVDAVVLKLTPHVAPLVRADFTTLETVVKALFQYRRKVIRKGAQLLFAEPDRAKELFSLSGVDDSLRAQQLTLAQFEQLCTAYRSLSQQQQHGHEHHFSSKFQVRTQKNT